MPSFTRALFRGAVAGAVGTTALNAATFLDMTLRGRPASQTPQQVVEQSAGVLGFSVPGGPEQRDNRTNGLGSLLGIASGVFAGLALGGSRAIGGPRGPAGTVVTALVLAMVAGNGPMIALGVTDPRTWRNSDWVADVLPHLAYAVAAAATLGAFDDVDAAFDAPAS